MKKRMKALAAAVCGLLILAAVAAEPVPLFGGSDSYVDLGTPAALQIPSNEPFTIEGWMLFNTVKSLDMFYCKNAGRTSPYTYMLGFYNGKMTAYNTAWRGNFPVDRETGRWYHVAFAFDGTNMVFYLDGTVLGSTAFSFANNTNHTVKIGGYTTSADINGSMSDVRVWDHAQSAVAVADNMHRRLYGNEAGLLGYWPLNEGSGATIYDQTANVSTGTLISATWAEDDELYLLPADAEFSYAAPFSLANIETGSSEFTNSNEVEVVTFPIPAGYDAWQIGQTGEVSEIDPHGWEPTTNPPPTLSFPLPAADTNVVLYAWFTNTADTVTVRRAVSSVAMYYTTRAPVPVGRATYERGLIPGYSVVVEPSQIDVGSSGGETREVTIPIHALALHLVSGPDSDATPTEPIVTVAAAGTYSIELIVVNAAGNVATSSVCQVEVTAYNGETFEWTGAADNDWHNPLNWDLHAVPVVDSDVVVANGANLLLANATADLASFTMSGGTLTFSNWTTRLSADDVRIEGGTVTTPAPAYSSTCSNRVHIVCTDFLLSTPAILDVNACGYGGAWPGPGIGPGAAGSRAPGHGGRGADYIVDVVNYTPGGGTYGDSAAPLGPGSSGGSGDARADRQGGHGGGSVCVEATGHVVVNGVITANGGPNGWRGSSSPGSGGAIWITCSTFAGTQGVVRADGVDGNNSGGSGGGRIAVAYDPVAQDALPLPDVTFSVYGGRSVHVTGESNDGDIGTLYFPDARLFGGPVIRHTGQLLFAASRPSFSFDHLVLSNAWIRFSNDVTRITVSNDLVITGNRGQLDVGGGSYYAGRGYWRIDNTSAEQNLLQIGGALVLTNGGALKLISTATNGVSETYGLIATINGDVDVAENSWLYLQSSVTNGGNPILHCSNLMVRAGGGISAYAAGFAGGHNSVAMGVNGARGGGGYGGEGGYYNATLPGGAPHGDPLRPLNSGTGGGSTDGRNEMVGGYGGGLVRIIAANRICVDGTIDANGAPCGRQYSGGGSGGAMLVECRVFEGSGHLLANGGYGKPGGGGGGRIAVWHGEHYADTISASRLLVSEAVPPEYEITAEVFGGKTHEVTGGAGEPGTIRFIKVLPPQGTMLLLR